MRREHQTYRPELHFTPEKGWINDPNGLVYFKGRYHLYYQYNPHHCNWDSMHWGHSVSTDLVSWEYAGIALYPDMPYDGHPEGGCFSGSVLEKDGRLYAFYTGSIKKPDGTVVQSQCIAWSEDGYHFEKSPHNPIIPCPPMDSVTDFRDPKVIRVADNYYMLVGASEGGADHGGKGRLFLYGSRDLENWEYIGCPIATDGSLGTMFECPDLFPLGDKWVISFSPMYHEKMHQAIYFVGDMDFSSARFTPVYSGQLDLGPDYYAAQSYHLPEHGLVSIAWRNAWQWMPWFCGWGDTVQEGWRGNLSIPRVLGLTSTGALSGKLLPLWEKPFNQEQCLLNLRPEQELLITETNRFYCKLELNTGAAGSRVQVTLGAALSIDANGREVTVTRFVEGVKNHQASLMLSPGKAAIHILCDRSCVTVWTQEETQYASYNIFPQEPFSLKLSTGKNTTVDKLQIMYMG